MEFGLVPVPNVLGATVDNLVLGTASVEFCGEGMPEIRMEGIIKTRVVNRYTSDHCPVSISIHKK